MPAHATRLTWEHVRLARSLHASRYFRVSPRRLAKLFDTTLSHMQKVLAGHIWKE